MLICFTGLHAAGKSYFLSKVSEYFNFKVYDKKQILRRLYYMETGKADENWNIWYGEKFAENPKLILSRILACIPVEENVILDAVHSSFEWELIHELVPDSYLALMITPEELRETRWERREAGTDRDLTHCDNKRIRYWHNPNAERECLPTHASWAFNGAAPLELNMREFQEFLHYVEHKEQINRPENVQVLKLERKPNE